MAAQMTRIAPHEDVHDDHVVVHPPTTLRDKGLSRAAMSPLELAEFLERGDKALDALAPSFGDWILGETWRLAESYEVFEAGPRDEAGAKALFIVTHDFRGLAKQFGYPLAAKLSEALGEVLQSPLANVVPAVILRSHVEAICAIVRSGVRDETNPTARAMVDSLASLMAEQWRAAQKV